MNQKSLLYLTRYYKLYLLIFLFGLTGGGILFYMLNNTFSHPISHSVINIIHSPENGNKIISLIDSANKSIDIEVYLLTSNDVIHALERAKSRGVNIRIILEKRVMGGANQNAFNQLTRDNIKTKWASNVFKLTHSKIIIIDGKLVVVGSHNLSYTALNKNREISLLIYDNATANDLETLFEQDWMLASVIYGN